MNGKRAPLYDRGGTIIRQGWYIMTPVMRSILFFGYFIHTQTTVRVELSVSVLAENLRKFDTTTRMNHVTCKHAPNYCTAETEADLLMTRSLSTRETILS